MDNLRLRGYTVPGDYTGTDSERMQKALDVAHEKDINKVIISGEYSLDKTVFVPALTEIIFDNATVMVKGDFCAFANAGFADKKNTGCSFTEKYFYIKGSNSIIKGDILFRNTFKVVAEDLEIHGALRFEFSREVRLERDKFLKSGRVILGRGSNNFIMQQLEFFQKTGTGIFMDTNSSWGEYVIGCDADIHEIILKDSKFETSDSAVKLIAGTENGIFNVQIDTLDCAGTAVEIGNEGEGLPEERYFNITAADFIRSKVPVKVNSKTKHCYFA